MGAPMMVTVWPAQTMPLVAAANSVNTGRYV